MARIKSASFVSTLTAAGFYLRLNRRGINASITYQDAGATVYWRES